jgi:hypothetical protein
MLANTVRALHTPIKADGTAIPLSGRTKKADILEVVGPHLDKAAAAEGAGEPGDEDDYIDPDEEDTKPKIKGSTGAKKKTRVESDDDE